MTALGSLTTCCCALAMRLSSFQTIKTPPHLLRCLISWQGFAPRCSSRQARQDSNLQPLLLESTALPIAPLAYNLPSSSLSIHDIISELSLESWNLTCAVPSIPCQSALPTWAYSQVDTTISARGATYASGSAGRTSLTRSS